MQTDDANWAPEVSESPLTLGVVVIAAVRLFGYIVKNLANLVWIFTYDLFYTARALVKNPKAWGPGSLKFLFLNAGKFTLP